MPTATPGQQHSVGRICHQRPLTRSLLCSLLPKMGTKSPLSPRLSLGGEVSSSQTVSLYRPWATAGRGKPARGTSLHQQPGPRQPHCSACSKDSLSCGQSTPPPSLQVLLHHYLPLYNPPILKPVQAPQSSSKTPTTPISTAEMLNWV